MKYLNRLLVGWLVISSVLIGGLVRAADSDVRVANIQKISLDEIGLLDDVNESLGPELWQGSDRLLVEMLTSELPTKTQSDTLSRLRDRMLWSVAMAPDTKYDNPHSLFEIKLKVLARLGQSLQVAQYIAQVPDDMQTPLMKQIYVAALFINDEYEQACKAVKHTITSLHALFWRKSLIICQAEQKKSMDVELGLSLLEEDKFHVDAEFKTIVQMFLDNSESEGKMKWQDVLVKDLLVMEFARPDLPDLNKLSKMPVAKKSLDSWLAKHAQLTVEEKLSKAAALFLLLDVIGVRVVQSDWQPFVMYAVYNDKTPSVVAMTSLLDISVKKQSFGQAILLILHIAGEQQIADLPDHVLGRIVKALRDMGFEEESQQLIAEAM